MNRRLFAILSTLSLLMCLAVCMLCVSVRMGWRAPGYRWERGVWRFVASADADGVCVARGMIGSRLEGSPELVLPYLVLIPALSIAPVGWVVATLGQKIRTRRRRARRLCTKCGYDLRATPEWCPECGIAKPHSGEDGRSSGEVSASENPGPTV